MQTIINRNGVELLSITRGEMARTLSIGTDWTRLRIGMLFSISKSSDNIQWPSFLAFGLCSGTSSLLRSINGYTGPNHWIGVRTSDQKGDWSWDPLKQSYDIFDPIINIIANTSSLAAVESTPQKYVLWGLTGSATNPTSSWNLQAWYMEYNKTPTNNWAISTSLSTTNDSANKNITFENFYNEMLRTNNMPIPNGNVPTACTLPVSESTYGYLDTIDIFWSREFGLEISYVLAYKLS